MYEGEPSEVVDNSRIKRSIKVSPSIKINTKETKFLIWGTHGNAFFSGTSMESFINNLTKGASKKMLIVIKQKINDIKNLEFWNSCYVNSRDNNDINFMKEKFLSWEEVLEYYGDLPYLVKRGDSPVGFFFDDFDVRSDAIGLSVYLPEDSMKQSLKRLNSTIVAGMLHNLYIYKSNNHKFLEFNTFSDYIVSLVTSFIPNITINKIRDTYIIMSGEINNLNLEDLSSLFGESLAYLFNDSYCFNIPDKIYKKDKSGKIKKIYFY
jgi:uncharacterized membrane protein YgaE (UPF0421/DUF939 family)